MSVTECMHMSHGSKHMIERYNYLLHRLCGGISIQFWYLSQMPNQFQPIKMEIVRSKRTHRHHCNALTTFLRHISLSQILTASVHQKWPYLRCKQRFSAVVGCSLLLCWSTATSIFSVHSCTSHLCKRWSLGGPGQQVLIYYTEADFQVHF